MSYRILAFDGGGIRGALSLKILELIDAKTPFLDKIDLFAGTSTGSFIALGLAMGLKPGDLLPLYTTEGQNVFVKSSHPIERVLGFEAKYTNEPLKKALEKAYKPKITSSKPLSDLPKKVAIPTFELKSPEKEGEHGRWEPQVLNNLKGSTTAHVSIIDAAMKSSAAPTYFPSYKGCVDGGISANNPSIAALSFAVGSGIPLEEVHLLSIGTGYIPHDIKGNESWGKVKWVENLFGPMAASSHPILTLFSDAEEEMTTLNCSHILGKRFCRLNPALNKPIALDDWKSSGELVEVAEHFMAGTQNKANIEKWIKKVIS